MIEQSAASDGIRLRTLGTLAVTGPDGRSLHALVGQPKRVALLVYVAAARPRGVQRRDTLLALLWPEADQAHARRALNQVVYELRRDIGRDTLVSRGDDGLEIAAERAWCDVTAFDAALAADRPAEALALYGGDFLNGFFVPDVAPELDEWISAERTRLRAAAAAAARLLLRREEQAGNRTGAAQWGHRAVALLPDDETAIAELVGLLGRLGDRTGALRVYDEFTRRLHQEFGLKPSGALRGLAEELRRTPAAIAPASVVDDGPPPVPPPAGAATTTRRVPRRFLWGAIVVTAGIALSVAVSRLGSRTSGAPTLAVGVIADLTHGDTAAGPIVGDLLATSLAQLSAVQVIPAPRLYEVQAQLQARSGRPASVYRAAREAGAGELLQGDLHPDPSGGVRLDLERIDITRGAVRAGYRVQGRDLFAAVDAAATAVAQDLGLAPPGRPVADVTTRSLVAFRFYEEGLRAYYQNDLSAADRLFRSALGEDSSFAMAAYWVWSTSILRGVPQSGFLEQAARLSERATDRERLLILEQLAETRFEPAAKALAETLGVRYPSDPDVQLALSRVRQIAGDFLGSVIPLHRILAVDGVGPIGQLPSCRPCDAYVALTSNYVWADSLAAAERIAREWERRQPASPLAWSTLGTVFELEGKADSALAAAQVSDSLSPAVQSLDPARVRIALRRGDYAEADARLRRMIAERTWSDAEWFLAISLRDQGRLREAARLSVAQQRPVRGIILFEQGAGREAATDFERAAHALVGPSAALVGHAARNFAFSMTHVATCLASIGDTARLAHLEDTVALAGAGSLFGRDALLAHYIRGLLDAARGQPALAATEYRKAVFSWNEGYTRTNYQLAKSLLQLGKPRDAIAALQPAFRGSLEASNLYITRTELHELLAQAFDAAGEHDSATAHWRAVESAWRNADPEFRARWEVAKRRTVGDGRGR